MSALNRIAGVVDVLGGTVLALCLGAFLWLVLVQNERTTADLQRLTRELQTAEHDTAALQAMRVKHVAALAGFREGLAESGQLPTAAPVEGYFEALSEFAHRHRLRVVRHQPLSALRYPGLVEQRYVYEVTGGTAELVRFLRDIEAASYWADVSFLKIETTTRPDDDGRQPRAASLTISLFSAAPIEPSQGTTGT
jgi:hypothetical protein